MIYFLAFGMVALVAALFRKAHVSEVRAIRAMTDEELETAIDESFIVAESAPMYVAEFIRRTQAKEAAMPVATENAAIKIEAMPVDLATVMNEMNPHAPSLSV